MIITSPNEESFRIQTSNISLLTEPPSGNLSGRLKADIFVKTTAKESGATNADHLIKGPGEYEIKGVEIQGLPHYSYLIKAEELNLAYLGNSAVSDFGTVVDLLLLTGDGGLAANIRQLQPKAVVVSGQVKKLERELGRKAEILDKLVIKKKDLAADGLRLICLRP